jgi:Tol biopolymer transport system component
VICTKGNELDEAFIVDLPDDLTIVGDAPLEGTATTRPAPPRGTSQRRLTRTEHRKFPGLQGPRHWLRSSPDGERIGLLMRDEDGIVQLWTVSPNGGEQVQVSRLPFDVASAFTWSPDGKLLAHVADHSVFVTEVASGESRRLTPRAEPAFAPRPEACVFSPDGRRIAYVRPVPDVDRVWNQVFVTDLLSD